MIIPPAPLRPPRRLNLVAAGLALVVLISLAPAIFDFQKSRILPPAQRSWRMPDILGSTQSELVGRFGAPMSTKDFSLQEGSFAGHSMGLKHFYPLKTPGYAQLLKDAPVTWTFPQYSTIREVIWKLPDSYLTVWLHEPRAEVNLAGDAIDMTLPKSPPGEWVALDNYRVGKDLVAQPR